LPCSAKAVDDELTSFVRLTAKVAQSTSITVQLVTEIAGQDIAGLDNKGLDIDGPDNDGPIVRASLNVSRIY